MIKIYNPNNKDFVSPYGTIYNLNCLSKSNIIYSEIPTKDLIFYNSFSNDSTIAETGQQLNITNSSYITKNLIDNNIPYWNFREFGNISNIRITENNLNYGNNPITLSIWIKLKSTTTDTKYGRIISLGNKTQYNEFALGLFSNSNSYYLTAGNGDSGNWTKGYYPDVDKWYHILAYSDGSSAHTYINGVFYSTTNFVSNNVSQSNEIKIGYNYSMGEVNLSSVRILFIPVVSINIEVCLSIKSARSLTSNDFPYVIIKIA